MYLAEKRENECKTGGKGGWKKNRAKPIFSLFILLTGKVCPVGGRNLREGEEVKEGRKWAKKEGLVCSV